MNDPSFFLKLPRDRLSCAVFSSPHSGSEYPQDFLARTKLGTLEIRSSEDAFVDLLFASAPLHGAPLLAARAPRAFVDLNRSPDDLDPAVIAGTARRHLTPRIAAGLGVIPRVVSEGRVIMDGKLPLSEARARLDGYWFPFHRRLRLLIEESVARHGRAILFDCHSMPRDALASAPLTRGRRPDIILGDRFGVSCSGWVMDGATSVFRDAGFVVTRNAPFAGGYITQSYGAPRSGVHALQIEINRALYMDERRIEPRPDFPEIEARISSAVSALARLGAQETRHAAE